MCLRHSNVSWIWRARLQYFSIVRCRTRMCVRMRKTSEKKKKNEWYGHTEKGIETEHIGSDRIVVYRTIQQLTDRFSLEYRSFRVAFRCAVLCCAMKLMPLPQSFTCMAIRKRARTNRQYTFQCYDYRHNMCCFYIHSTSILLWNILVFVYVVAWTREEERNKTYARYALRFMCACSPLFYSDYLNLRQQIDKIFFLWPINCFAEMIQWILT